MTITLCSSCSVAMDRPYWTSADGHVDLCKTCHDKEVKQMSDDETCEGCGQPATHHDADWVPLCRDCWKSLCDEQKEKKPRDIYEIVEAYLRENGYDGLVNTEFECGCRAGKLLHCDSWFGRCVPAKSVKCDAVACNTCSDMWCDKDSDGRGNHLVEAGK